jgi:hypothetical protein
MRSASIARAALVASLAVPFALSAYAATSNNPDMTKNAPSSVDESSPDKTGKKDKGKAGVNTMPGKGPSSANESAPDKTGKDKAAAKMKDSKDMPNPKSPQSSNETKPSYPQK